MNHLQPRAYLSFPADVPYDLTPKFLDELLTKHRIDYVIHGDDPCILPGAPATMMSELHSSKPAMSVMRSVMMLSASLAVCDPISLVVAHDVGICLFRLPGATQSISAYTKDGHFSSQAGWKCLSP